MTKRLLLIAFILFAANTVLANSLKLTNYKDDISKYSSKSLATASVPVLLNFRVEGVNKNRVYFDSSAPLTGSSINGFTISGKTITGITINSGQTTGHYFTLSSNFTFWSNNTIRYRGGSDLGIHNIDMEYIKNNIPEPVVTGTNYYVSLSGSNSNDGLTEATAWRTLRHALSSSTQVKSGDAVHVKAGNYGAENVETSKNRGASATKAPIFVIGYQNTPNDNPDTGWSHPNNTELNPNIMPLYRGNGSGRGFDIGGDNIIIKNFQIDNYHTCFRAEDSAPSRIWIDNVIATNAAVYNIKFGNDGNYENRITNSIALNGGTKLIEFYGTHLFIDNTTCIEDDDGVDYYIAIRGNNNIVRNSYMEKTIDRGHTGHGISVKSVGRATEYGLYENLRVGGIKLSIEARHDEVKNNVFRNIDCFDNGKVAVGNRGGINIMNGASANIFDKITVDKGKAGIYFLSTSEDRTAPTAGFDNIIKNSNFSNGTYGIRLDEDTTGQNRVTYNNYIINCNFYNNSLMFANTSDNLRDNHIINSNIINTKTKEKSSSNATGWDFQNCNFLNNNRFPTPTGNGNIAIDPLFINAASGNFKLQPNSPVNIKDGGINNNNVRDDFESKERINDKYSIGAFEDEVSSVGSVSPDVSICTGESTTLVASGGTSYLWNTGQTTSSITVNPTTTSSYTVTISDGVSSDDYEINVTINELPTVNIAEDEITICEGESIDLTADGEGDFLWSNGETTATITVNPTTTTTYTVTASNSCTQDATDEIIVNVTPAIVVSAGDDVTICSGDTVTLNATGNNDFLWSNGETTSSITVNPTTTETYTVTSSSGSCTLTDEVVVTVDNPPLVTLEDDITICSGEDVVLTATGEGNFLWSTGETTPTIRVSPSETETFTVTATSVCDTVGVTDGIVVNVTPELVLDAGADAVICSGDSVTLTAIGNGDFLWSTGETTASITVNPTDSTLYTVTSSLGGCSVIDDDIYVMVDNPPAVELGENITICEGESITLTAEGNGDFVWSTGETVPSITVTPTTTTTYTIVASSSCAADVTDEITVIVTPGITLNAGADTTICLGESITLTAESNGDDFLWSTGDTTQSITVNPSSTIEYTVTSTLGGSCSLTDEVIINVSQPPNINAGDDVVICEGESVTLRANGSGNFLWSNGATTRNITVSPTATQTYSVATSTSCGTVTDDVIVSVTPAVIVDLGDDVTICEGESITLTAEGNGDFLWSTGQTTQSITVNPINTITYTVTSSLGNCSQTDNIIVNVRDLASVNAGRDATICLGDSVTLRANGSGNFLWSNGATTRSITVSPTETETYTVTATNSCSTVSDDVIVNVTPLVTIDAGLDVTICKGEVVTLTAEGNGDFRWNTGETTRSINVSPSNSRTYIVSSSLGSCTKTDNVRVTVNQTVVVDAGLDVTICQGEVVTLTAEGNGEDFLWSTGETTQSINVNPNESITYTVSSSLGPCSNTDNVRVVVNEMVTVDIDAGLDVAICSGEVVTLTAEGNGSFLWSTGETTATINVSPSTTTTYSVTASASCATSVSDEIIVTVNQLPTLSVSSNITINSGTTVDLIATGNGDFLWSTGETSSSISVSPLETTLYTVTLTTDSDCSAQETITVTVGDDSMDANAGADITTCPNFPDVVLTAVGGDSYVWNTGETTASISVNPKATTTYSVKILIGNTQLEDDVTVFYNEKCNNALDQEVVVYPNPTEGLLNIEVTDFSEKMNISIFNLNGQTVYTESFDKTSNGKLSHRINLSRFGKGVYIVRFSNRYKSTSKKVLVI